jgi:predicted XRE-type DNA-binding protein/Tfp pilus assembly protein PilF
MTKKSSKGAAPTPAIHPGTYKLRFMEIREQLMVQVASVIQNRNWSQAQAAAYLGVSQPRISDLMRAKGGKFTGDTLIQWLLAMGKDVTVVVEDSSPIKKAPPPARPDRVTQAEEAIAFFSRAIGLDPKDVGSYMNRGDKYAELKQFDLAIGDYTRAIELAPDRPGPRNQRALAYRFSGQLKAALQEACDLIALFPDYSGGYAQRAGVYSDLGDYEKAVSDYSKAIEMEPDRPGAYYNRASIYDHLGQYQNAIDDFDQAIKLHPSPDFARQARVAVAQKLLSSGDKSK